MYCVGIDLGTCNATVSVWRDDAPELIPNFLSHYSTPSCVAFIGNEMILGGREQMQIDSPQNVIYNIKRLIGRNYSEAFVQEEIKKLPYKVVGVGDKILIELTTNNKIQQFTPEEITAILFQNMKSIAEAHLGKVVTKAVITVPFCFTDLQRQAMKDAATIAGLSVLRILNESTAAALDFLLIKNCVGMRQVIVFRLGGGTMDVSFAETEDGVLNCTASSGDNFGGEDLTNNLYNYLLQQIEERYHGHTFHSNAVLVQRLKIACESAKQTLATQEHATIEINNLFPGVIYKTDISRDLFENLNESLFQRCKFHLDAAVGNNDQLQLDKLDIVLLGGASNTPKLRTVLAEYFGGRIEPIFIPNGAARGAAIYGAILSPIVHPILHQVLYIDICSRSYSYMEEGDLDCTPLIAKCCSLPTRRTFVIPTRYDNQHTVRITIFDNEPERHVAVQVTICGIAPAPMGVVRLEVTADIDANGIMYITAIDKIHSRHYQLVITQEKGRLKPREIEEMAFNMNRAKTRNYLAHKERIAAKQSLESCQHTVKNLLDSHHLSNTDRDELKKFWCN